MWKSATTLGGVRRPRPSIYSDELAEIGDRGDGENYQIGFLDICDPPYAETVAAAREMGGKLYLIRSGKK